MNMKYKFKRFWSSEFVALSFKWFKISDLDFGSTKEIFGPISGEKDSSESLALASKVAFETTNRLWVTNLRLVCHTSEPGQDLKAARPVTSVTDVNSGV